MGMQVQIQSLFLLLLWVPGSRGYPYDVPDYAGPGPGSLLMWITQCGPGPGGVYDGREHTVGPGPGMLMAQEALAFLGPGPGNYKRCFPVIGPGPGMPFATPMEAGPGPGSEKDEL
nr:MAGEA4/LAGE1/NY-ESO1 fusion protein [synthetic construct]